MSDLKRHIYEAMKSDHAVTVFNVALAVALVYRFLHFIVPSLLASG